MQSKKAQMSSSFNYIFAIIIGGIIFMFFVGFAYKFMGFGESIGAAGLVTSMNDEFAAFSASDSAEKTLSFNKETSFRVYEAKVISEGQSKQIDHIVYAPFLIEGRDIFISTKALELPYRVGNVFYVDDGSTLYILVYDSVSDEVVEDLVSSYNSIPTNLPTYSVDVKDINTNVQDLVGASNGYDNVRFIFFTKYDTVLSTIQSNFGAYEILYVTSSENDYSSGYVVYPDGSQVAYLTYPLLIGAMVSGDAYMYSYNYDLVMEKVSRVSNVYLEKSKLLATRLPNCEYTLIKSALGSYMSILGNDGYSSYVSNIENIEEENKKLGGDCPEVY